MPSNDSPPSVPKFERWGMEVVVDREAMFEKALTPSDVGKLNRLVIPKQHAERYFPVEIREKGIELSFEDEAGKVWSFRYSYWSSSQSYVLTKGWSRFVKENMLHAGDVVSFDRCHGDRLYISCRRRATFCPASAPATAPSSHATCNIRGEGHYVAGNSLVPATSKRLRLFGVNLDFPADEPNVSCWSSQGQTDATFFQRVQSSGSTSQS